MRGGPRVHAWLLSWWLVGPLGPLPQATAAPAPPPATQTPSAVLLPPIGVGSMPARYLGRLQRSLQRAAPPPGREADSPAARLVAAPADLTWPAPAPLCVQQAACLDAVAEQLGAPFVVAPVLDAQGPDFVVRLRLGVAANATRSAHPHDASDTPGSVPAEVQTHVPHARLKRAGRAVWDTARQQVADAQRAAAGATDARSATAAAAAAAADNSQRDAAAARLVEMAQQLGGGIEIVSQAQLVAEAERRAELRARQPPAPVAPPSPAGSDPAATTTADTVAQAGGQRTAGAEAAAVAPADPATSDARTGDATPLGIGKLAARRQRSADGGKRTWNARRAAFGKHPAPASTDRGLLALLAVGLLGLSCGFSLVYVLPPLRVARRRFRTLSTSGNTPEAAAAQAAMLHCCKRVAPGIVVSTESAETLPFRFAIYQGGTVAIDVALPKAAGAGPFRRGGSVALQFVQDQHAAVCATTILRANRSTAKVLRVVLDAPSHIVPIELPRSFRVPVLQRDDLDIALTSEGGALLAAATHLSAEGIDFELDGTAGLSSGAQVMLSVKMGARVAELTGVVTAHNDNHLAVAVPAPGGPALPQEYERIAQQVRLDWLATARSA